MHLAWLVVLVLLVFSAGYLGYSRYLAHLLELDDCHPTPAHRHRDDQEYVPARKIVLIGHHFSSIAGGAPIVGPITAALIWGWIPALLWILIGNPLMGAVHDFVSMVGSLRHEGRSIGSILGTYLGERSKRTLLWFAFLTVILVIAVFALVIGIVFDAYPQAATASMIYIGLALLFGVYMYKLNLPFVTGTIGFVAAVFVSVGIGYQYPVALFPSPNFAETAPHTITLFSGSPPLPEVINPNISAWILVVLGYGFVASVLPVWLLLQPRDYLSSYLLYTGIGGTLLAILIGTLLGSSSTPLTINIPAYQGFWGGEFGPVPLFPGLFVMIACGAISGFHSLVASGTTAKQLHRESDARLIGYGGMLGEGLLATAALATVAVVAQTPAQGGIGLALPNFASGGGAILTSFGIPIMYGAPFMALVLVSFLLTSTDTAIRLGRYMIDELADQRSDTPLKHLSRNAYSASGIQVLGGYLLIISGSWTTLWALFGSANQLLAALALLAATVWLVNWDVHKPLLSTGGPTVVISAITMASLLYFALYENLFLKLLNMEWLVQATMGDIVSIVVQALLSCFLFGLATLLIWQGSGHVLRARRGALESPVPVE